MTLRDIPSVIAPFVVLLAIAAGLVAAISAAASRPLPWIVWLVPAAAAMILIARAVRIAGNLSDRGPAMLARALAVSSVYEVARAAALVTRAPHHRR
jgi:hypothetical protein